VPRRLSLRIYERTPPGASERQLLRGWGDERIGVGWQTERHREKVEKTRIVGREGQAGSSFESSSNPQRCFKGSTVRHRRSSVAIAQTRINRGVNPGGTVRAEDPWKFARSTYSRKGRELNAQSATTAPPHRGSSRNPITMGLFFSRNRWGTEAGWIGFMKTQ
jgi:hypothetical protein